MVLKGVLLIGLGFLALFGLGQSPRALEKGVRDYLQRSFPRAPIRVRVSAPPFWFLTGNLRRIAITMWRFDATNFPIPVGEPPEATVSPGDAADAGTPDGERPTVLSTVGLGVLPDRDPMPARAPTRWARIGSLDLHLQDFVYRGQNIADFHCRLPSVRYDWRMARRKRLLRLGGSGTGTVRILISEVGLNQAAAIERADIRNLHIVPERGHLRVNLDYNTLVGSIPVSVTGQLAIVDGHAIHFVNPTITAASVTLPQTVSNYILSRVQNINPVFDLNRLDLRLTMALDSATSTDEGLILRGSIAVPRVER